MPETALRARSAAAPIARGYVAQLLADADGRDMQATALNGTGSIVGVLAPDEPGGPRLAFLAEGHALTTFGDPGALMNVPQAINDAGDIVGHRHDGREPHAFISRRGGLLEALAPHARASQAMAINADGAVALVADGRGYVWRSGVLTEVAPLPGTAVRPLGINGAGVVIGEALGARQRAFSWHAGVTTELRGLPGPHGDSEAHAVAINDAGEVVGNCLVDGFFQPCRWIDGEPEALGLLPGGLEGSARGINALGAVTGCAYAGGRDAYMTHPFLHANGRLHDLRELVEMPHHVELVAGLAIDDRGEILAEAVETVGWQQYIHRYYLLVPR